MKACIYNGPGSISFREIDLPPCGEKDIIIKNLYAGICGSDIAAYQHDGTSMRIYPGSEFGHEMVSRVVEVGKHVEGLQVGDRVYPYPMFAKDDRTRSATVGGFSQYVHIPNCRLDHSVYKLPDSISDRVAAMIEPFTVGARAAVLSQPKPGQKAIVFGAGIIGMAAAITLRHLGCEQVMLVNRSVYRLKIAKKMGFFTCSPSREDLKETAMAALGTGYGIMGATVDADIYIDATSSDDAYHAFEQLGKLNSIFTVVGLHHCPLTVNILYLTFASKRIQGSGGYTPKDVELVLEIMASGKYDLEQLITHTYPQGQLEAAIQKAAATSESMKVLIQY
jgi:2-desacetyl-2-hydroxyethyl bacteriochlorophyllide A dehydrogenase